jgi:type II secretory pathway pseudopilin PulG
MGTIAAVVVILTLIALLLPWVLMQREAARRVRTRNYMRQLGLALHSYHESYRCFSPGGVIGEDGTAYHGWYTFLIPFFLPTPLYNRIDFNRPWDDPRNDYVFQEEMWGSLNPSVHETRTAEGYVLLHYLANPHVLHRNSSVSQDDLTAGPAHTWLLGEAGGNFTPYAYPFNWRPLGEQLNRDADGYGLPHATVAHLLMADGSVAAFSKETAPEVLRVLAEAPPVPADEAMALPPLPSSYRSAGWRETAVRIDSSDEGRMWAVALVDRDGAPQRVWFTSYKKWGGRNVTVVDLRTAAAEFPAMKELKWASVIDDEAADVLASLPNLEAVHAAGLLLTDAGLARLAEASTLRKLTFLSLDDSDLKRLREALPGWEIEGGPASR